MAHPLIQTLRPKQWTKNLVVFAGLIFAQNRLLMLPAAWGYAFFAFVLFCALSGCVYIMNDLVDREKDQLHPEKCKRPIASGALSPTHAKLALFGLFCACLAGASFLDSLFFVSAFAYFALNIAYSFWLKNVVILDVLCIAIGFVLRAQAGVGALRQVDPGIYMSHWLVLCGLMLALFLALAKRRGEISKLRADATEHRKILKEYSPHFIDEITAIVSAITIMSYATYTVSTETITKFGTDKLVYTLPFVLYGIFRYQYLIHIKDLGDNPSELVLTDRPLQINFALWVVTVIGIIHFQ
jgi:4-hydroxybenzoate polyprenyltransferase